MKRFTSWILCLALVFSLCACDKQSETVNNASDFTQPEPVTLSDGSTIYSREPFVEFPQTGEYKETALLTNVPGQGVPLLLDMRQDGTIDYIFADIEENAAFQTFSDSGVQYYTIAPDGTDTKQDSKRMEDLDHYMATTLETTQDPNGKWRLLFAAEEGTILILAQFHNVVQTLSPTGMPVTKGQFLYSTLFKVASGQVTIIPLEWEVDIGKKIVDLRLQYISSIELENGQIEVNKRDALDRDHYENLCTVIFNMDGTVASAKEIYDKEVFLPEYKDPSGFFVHSLDYSSMVYFPELSPPRVRDWEENPHSYSSLNIIPYPETDPLSYSIYHHSKWHDNVKAVAQSGTDFCCWMDEAGTGVLMRYTHNPEDKIYPEVLTVWSFNSHPAISAAIAQWNATHATPVFRYDWELHQSYSTKEEILTRLNLMLLNGQGPDVIILDGLNVDNYLEFMVPLDASVTEGVYESILTRFTVGEDLLAVPVRVSPYLLGSAAEGTEEIQSISQFADVGEENTWVIGQLNGINKYDRPSAPYKMDDYAQLFQLWYPAWQDAIWEGGELNRETFKEFLTQTTRLCDIYGLDGGSGEIDGTFSWEDYQESNSLDRLASFPYFQETDGRMVVEHEICYPYTLAAPDHVGLYTYWRYANKNEANQKPDPHYLSGIPGPEGTGIMVPSVIAGVRAGGNEAAGQEFIKLLLSREMQMGYAYHYPSQADGYPVIWEYTEELLERTEDYMNQEYAVLNDYEEVMNSLRTVVIDDYLFEHALDAAVSCYRTEDRRTPEEAAEALYEATRIYLAELR